MKSKSILFFYTNYTSFVRTDFEILSSEYHVKKYQFKPVKGLFNTGIELIKQFAFLAIHIWKYDAGFIWFADYHSLLPVLFTKITGKSSFVVIGGYEVCRIKDLDYGALGSKFRGFFCIKSMQWSTLNLTVSKYIDRKVKYIAPSSKRQLVPNCVDLIQPANPVVKEKLVLTVGIIENQRSFFLKGIDVFIEVARNKPDFQFIIIGLDRLELAGLLTNLPVNITISGRLAHDELPAYYAKAMFYCQFSRSESFGVAIAEAMLYGCIPIVTNEGGMPELVGETGYIVRREPAEIIRLMSELASDKPGLQNGGAKRIIGNFSRAKRGKILVSLISKITIDKNN